MSYAEVDDIKNEFKKIQFDEENSVKSNAVQDWIDQACAEIDSRISARYIVPVEAGEQALLYLKQICIGIVAQRTKDALQTKNVRVESDQDVKTDTAALARKLLAEIVQGDVALLGATLASSDSGVKSFVSSSNFKRTWRRGEDQW